MARKRVLFKSCETVDDLACTFYTDGTARIHFKDSLPKERHYMSWKDIDGVFYWKDTYGDWRIEEERYQRLYKRALKRQLDRVFEKVVLT